MSTITITTSRTYTAEDYYYEHIAPDLSQFAIDDIWNALEQFLDEVGAELDRRSEWSWCTPHGGVRAEGYADMILYPQKEIDESYCEICYDFDFLEIWTAYRPKLEMLRRQYHRMDNKADRAWDCERLDEYEHYQRRADALASAYFSLLEETLETICDKAEWLMDDVCNHYYNDETCAEWIFDNEDLFDEED